MVREAQNEYNDEMEEASVLVTMLDRRTAHSIGAELVRRYNVGDGNPAQRDSGQRFRSREAGDNL